MKIHRIQFRAACSVLAIAMLSAASSVSAQSAADDQQANPSGGLEDIVVTAQRRSENLQRVPISVTAVTPEILTSVGIQRVTDLQQVAPGLVTYQVAASFLPYIRGIGSSLSQAGFDSSIAIYIDGIYQANKASNVFELNSVERVEVLKGPQGTLFGRNATGGAINVVTKDPGSNAEFSAEAGYGRFDEKRFRLFGSGPLTDKIGINFALAKRSDDGYVRDVARNRNIARTDKLALSAKLVWNMTDDLNAKLSFLYNNDKDNTSLSTHVLPGTVSTAEVAGFAVTRNNYESRLSADPIITSKSIGTTLQLNYDLGSANIVSISGYRHGTFNTFADSDLSNANLAYSSAPNRANQFSQELQLVSDNSGPLQFIGGLFYIWDDQGYDDTAPRFGLNIASNVPPPPVTAANLLVAGASIIGFDTRQTTKARAAFTQATYSISDSDRITAGLRYGSESKKVYGRQFRLSGVAGTGGAAPTILDTTLATVNAKKTFNRVTWRLAYDHQFSDRVMGYATYNRGFKSGAYNPNTVRANPPVVNPETLDAFEVGIKSELFDRKLRFNASAFYYDYRDIQVQLIAAGATTTENAGAAEAYGLDVDIVAVPTPALTIRGGLNLLHSEYTKYPAASVFVPRVNAAGVQTGGAMQVGINAKGLDTVFAPKITANIGFDYEIPAGDSRFVIAGSAYYNDGYDVAPGGINAHIRSFETVNASLTYYSADDRYFVRLWGENLTKDVHPIYLSPQAAAYQVANNRPISYGITVGVKFNQ